MRILSIETSCDETAVSIVQAAGTFPHATYEVLGTGLLSQTATHAPYGGVFPSLAKRDHIENLVPMFRIALQEAGLYHERSCTLPLAQQECVKEVLHRESALATACIDFMQSVELPDFDVIAVTNGPGLAPALWVGVNFAKALATLTDTPVVPVDHMEGHILASVFDIEVDDALSPLVFPAVALLISGGHTELIQMSDWGQYQKVGQTRDDAVGEAFDKVARLLDLPYPGGPEIERLTKEAYEADLPPFKADMPRPMVYSGDLDFSFSGLKTAVRYAVADRILTDSEKQAIARDFSDAVAEVLLKKAAQAVEQSYSHTLIVGGGVSASQFLRDTFITYFATNYPDVTVYFPHRPLATDNAIMIALAGHARATSARTGSSVGRIAADSNRSLS